MKVIDTRLAGIKRIELDVFHDDRGCFLESYQAQRYAQLLGDSVRFLQDNTSHSRQGVLRGLHYQVKHPQGKLLRVVQGEIFDVVVDLRRNSPTFGQWDGHRLSSAQHALEVKGGAAHIQLWIPPGFAHGFFTLSETAVVEYKCTDYYHSDDEACLLWSDPDLAIAWPGSQPLLSDKDRAGLTLQALQQAGRLP